MLALIGLGTGLVVGSFAGGSLRALATVHITNERFVLALFVLQGIARGRLVAQTASRVGVWIWLFTSIALVILLMRDWRQPGVWLVQMGLLMNALVVIANGGMPVILPDGLTAMSAVSVVSRSAGFYQIAHVANLALSLADVLLLNLRGFRFLFSSGDLLMVAGISSLIQGAMLGQGVASAN